MGIELTLLLVILLTVLWGAVFVPAILRARQETSPIVTVGSFRRGMRALGARSSYRSASRIRDRGRWILMPVKPESRAMTHRQTLARRRRIFAGLLISSAASLVMGLAPGMRELLRIHIAMDLVLVVYVAFLIQAKQRKFIEESVPAPAEETEDTLARVGQLS